MDEEKLLNKQIIDKILDNDVFAASHHGVSGHLGGGMFYYSLAYMRKAKLAVCLGSGSGFVPKLMRQAQIDSGIADLSETHLVDADMPELGWGGPDYYTSQTPFTKNYPDIKIHRELTKVACQRFSEESIDYLHIDADHSYAGVKADFENYLGLVKLNGLITLHDSFDKVNAGVNKLVNELRGKYDICNIGIGTGVAIMGRVRP